MEDLEFLETLGRQIKIDVGISQGFFLADSGKLMCGAAHNIEAQPVAKKTMYHWLKNGMSTQEVDVLLAKDLIALDKVMQYRYADQQWFLDFSQAQKLGWYGMAYIVGAHIQVRLYKVFELLTRGEYGANMCHELTQLDPELYPSDIIARLATMVAFNEIPQYYSTSKPTIIQPTLVD